MYYYKLCREIGIIYVKFEEDKKNKALKYFQKANDVYNSMCRKNIYMKKMFGSKYDMICCEAIKKNINIAINESDIKILTEE